MKLKRVVIKFNYVESCRHVYKKVEYYFEGWKTTANKKEIAELLKTAPSILTQNTYFWSPGGTASQRRRNEEKKINEFKEWIKSLGGRIRTLQFGTIAGYITL